MALVDPVTITARLVQETSSRVQAVILLHQFLTFIIPFVYRLVLKPITKTLVQEYVVYAVHFRIFIVRIVLLNQLVTVVILAMFY